MRHSTETITRTNNSAGENQNNFRLNKITVEHGRRRTPTKGEMVPFSLGLEDGRDAELYVGVNPRHATPEASKQYEKMVSAIPAGQPEQAAKMLFESYQYINDSGEKISQPASFLIGKNGEVSWSADVNSDTTGLVLVREDAVEWLGAKDEKYGVISDLTAKDMLYMAPNSLIGAMQDTSQLDKEGLKQAFVDQDEQNEMIRVRFNEAVPNTPADYAKARSTENLVKTGVRHPNAQQSAHGRHAKQAAASTQTVANTQQAATGSGATNGTAATARLNQPPTGNTSDTDNTLGFSEMVRLAANVEKYTQKVASYEELATEALARRMKGRLFKAPTYKTQAEREAAEKALKDSGKENSFGTKLSQVKEKALDKLQAKSKKDAKLDEDYMYLLEGFSRALDGALMKQWLAEGHSDEEVSKMLYEHQQTRQEARASRNHAELRKGKMASFLDKYANMPKGKKIAVTIGAAGVVGAVGLVAGGALGVAGAVGLAGAKVGKTYLQQRSKLYEEKRDESMPGPDRAVSVANGKVSTDMTAAEQVFAGRKYDQAKREKAIKEADRNKKLAVGVAAVSAVLLGAGVAGKIAEHSDDIQKFWNRPLAPNVPAEVNPGDNGAVAEAPELPESAPAPEPTPKVQFSADALTVTNGEGWYQTIQEVTGVTDPAQQAAILQKVGPALQEKGWAYPMNDGTWGISQPGTLPRDVLELIKNSR